MKTPWGLSRSLDHLDSDARTRHRADNRRRCRQKIRILLWTRNRLPPPPGPLQGRHKTRLQLVPRRPPHPTCITATLALSRYLLLRPFYSTCIPHTDTGIIHISTDMRIRLEVHFIIHCIAHYITLAIHPQRVRCSWCSIWSCYACWTVSYDAEHATVYILHPQTQGQAQAQQHAPTNEQKGNDEGKESSTDGDNSTQPTPSQGHTQTQTHSTPHPTYFTQPPPNALHYGSLVSPSIPLSPGIPFSPGVLVPIPPVSLSLPSVLDLQHQCH